MVDDSSHSNSNKFDSAQKMFSFQALKAEGKLQQFVTIVTATLSAVSDGMQYAWTAPIIPRLQGPDSHIQIFPSDVLWLENIYMLGAFAGIPFIMLTVDRFGRKTSILIGVVQSMISWILIAFAPSVEYLYVARFLSGLATDVGYVTVPMYAAEIAHKQIRGLLGSWYYLMMLVGILVMYSVGPFVSIPVSSAVGFLFLLAELCTFPFMPESPYHYVVKGNLEAARSSLQRLRQSEDVDTELSELVSSIQMQLSEKSGFMDLVTTNNGRKALLIAALLNFSQHFSSYSVMVMNVHSILSDAGVTFDTSSAAIVFSTLMLLSATISAVIVDKIGRKVLLCSSSALSGLSVLILAVYFALKNGGVNVVSYTWIPVLSVMSYAIVFKYGLGLVSIVVGAEIFPTSVRSLGMTMGDTMYAISSILSIYMYQALKELCGIHVPFFIFAGCSFFMAFFTAYAIPETKGKTLGEIQLMLKGQSTTRDDNVESSVNCTEGSHL